MMKKTLFLLIAAVMLSSLAVFPAAAEGVRCRVGISVPGDFGFLVLGDSVALTAALDGADDPEFSPDFKYAVETGEKNAAVGFVWKPIEKTDRLSASFTPDREGLYFFAAEGEVAGVGRVSSLDTKWCSVLAVDPAKKKTVATRAEFLKAVDDREKIISVSGDVTIEDAGDVQVNRMTVIDVPAEAALRLFGTDLILDGSYGGTGKMLIGGSLEVGDNSSIAGNGGSRVFFSGEVAGTERISIPLTRCNSAVIGGTPLFTVDPDSGITAEFSGLGNYQFLQVGEITQDSNLFLRLNRCAPGKVICAYRTAVGGYDGQYILSVPLGGEYEGRDIRVCVISPDGKTVKTRLTCLYGKVSFPVDGSQPFMIKPYVPGFFEGVLPYIIGAAILIILAAGIGLITRRRRKKE